MKKLHSQIIDGHIRERESLETMISSAQNGYYIIDFKRKRSLPTNNYFHQILGELAEALKEDGFTFQDVKNAVKMELGLYKHLYTISGIRVVKYISSADFSPEQMNDAINLIIRWGAERSIIILTSEEWKEQFESH
jgi:hypothetical protein